MARRNTIRGEKPKKTKATIHRLIKLFKPSWGPILLIVLILVLSSALRVTTPILLRDIMNRTTPSPSNPYLSITAGIISINWPPLLFDFGLILLFYILSAVLRWLSTWVAHSIAARYEYQMRRDYKEKLDRLPLSFFDSKTRGELLSRGINDVEAISQALPDIIVQSIASISLLLGAIVAMFIVSWELSLVALAIIPVSVIISGGIAIASQKHYVKQRKVVGEMESFAEESFGGYSVIQLFSREDSNIETFNKISSNLIQTEFKGNFYSSVIYPVMRFVSILGYVAVTISGALIEGLFIGDIIAFLTFLNIFSEPFTNLGMIVNSFQATIAGAERIFEVFDAEEMTVDHPDAISTTANIKGAVVFENVDFSYSVDRQLIENLNLTVNPGEMIAIVGPTGAGKTTLVNLIMRFYEINGGSIKLDGIDIRDYKRSTIRSAVGMVLQDTWLFAGSIRNNIRYGRSDATDEEVIAAAKSAHADHFIQTLPGGYEFVLNEDGSNVSQGQRQLLTIARAMLSQPKLLILDEATSSVDTRTESLIQEAMREMMKDKTSFVIAHRLSTIKNAKMIIVMKNGNIVETGSHTELLVKNGFYAELYNAQFLGTTLGEKSPDEEETHS